MPLALNHPRCQVPDEQRETAEIIETIQSQICSVVYPASLLPSHTCTLSRFRHVRLFVTLWTVACQAPLSMRFSRQEQWSGLACPPLGDLPDPGIKPMSLMSPALAGGFFTTTRTIWEWENNNQKSMGCYCTKAVLKGKFIVIQAHTGNFLKSHINNLILYPKEWGKEEQNKV